MRVQERVLASRLSERIDENREYAEKIGVSVIMRKSKNLPDVDSHKTRIVSKNSIQNKGEM